MKSFEDLIYDIKENVNLVDLISTYIHLEKSGSGFKGCCPFHDEKTPSFHVNVRDNYYKCFGCGEGGDALTFLQKKDNLDFKEVIKKLAEKSNISLSDYSFSSDVMEKNKVKLDRQRKILERATIFFQNNLIGQIKVQSYLKDRGIDKSSIEKFRLGYAKSDWDSLLQEFADFKQEDLIELGLIRHRDNGKKYDYFRDRLVCPIFNYNGQTIGFTCRDLSNSDKVPKYINSPNNNIFNKSKELYGLNFAQNSFKKGYVILAEGAFDLIALHQNGFPNSVISCGTSITIQQLSILKKYTDNLLIAYDGDKAGQRASFRCLVLALEIGFHVKIIDLIDTDPAELLNSNKNKFINLIKDKDDGLIYFVKKIFDQESDKIKQIKQIEKSIFPVISKIKDKLLIDDYLEKIAKIFSLKISSLEQSYSDFDDNFSNLDFISNEDKTNSYPSIDSKSTYQAPREDLIEHSKTHLAFLLNLKNNPTLNKLINQFFLDTDLYFSQLSEKEKISWHNHYTRRDLVSELKNNLKILKQSKILENKDFLSENREILIEIEKLIYSNDGDLKESEITGRNLQFKKWSDTKK